MISTDIHSKKFNPKQMSKKNPSIPIIVGIGILFLVPLGIGAAITTTFQAEENEKQEIEDTIVESSPFSDAKSKQSLEVTPLPQTGSIGSGTVDNQIEGIPTGTYSNPPASIGSSGGELSNTSRPLEDFDSSTEDNQLRQRDNNGVFTDFSSPAASNNFNSTDSNSLVAPLEDDSFLEVPDSDNAPTSITPSIEPLGINSEL